MSESLTDLQVLPGSHYSQPAAAAHQPQLSRVYQPQPAGVHQLQPAVVHQPQPTGIYQPQPTGVNQLQPAEVLLPQQPARVQEPMPIDNINPLAVTDNGMLISFSCKILYVASSLSYICSYRYVHSYI